MQRTLEPKFIGEIRKAQRIGWFALWLGALSLVMQTCHMVPVSPALAHDGPDAVSHFYARWMRPDLGRHSSCCNNEDCHTVATRRSGNEWQFQWQGQWWPIPEKVLEHNYPDAEDSPDGTSHACFHYYPETGTMYVFCAVLGGGA